MSGLMPEFFANMVPYVAFLWSLELVLFFYTIQKDNFNSKNIKNLLGPLGALGFVGLFLLLPIRSCLNRCCKGKAAEARDYYENVFHTFPTDYDRENPVTKKEGMKRLMEKKISMASGEERQRLML